MGAYSQGTAKDILGPSPSSSGVAQPLVPMVSRSGEPSANDNDLVA